MYSVFGREIAKYTVIYGVYIRFWPTLVNTSQDVCCFLHVGEVGSKPWDLIVTFQIPPLEMARQICALPVSRPKLYFIELLSPRSNSTAHILIRTSHIICSALLVYPPFLGLARTVCIHRIWPYFWWYLCQKSVYTPYIYGSGQPYPFPILKSTIFRPLPSDVLCPQLNSMTEVPGPFAAALAQATCTPVNNLALAYIWRLQTISKGCTYISWTMIMK